MRKPLRVLFRYLLLPYTNAYPCVAGYAVCQDASSPGPSASGQRHCIKSSLTRIYSAAAVLLARQLLMKESVVLDAL
jgi:hypothetical protein